MSSRLVYTDDDVSVDLIGPLKDFVQQAVAALENGAVVAAQKGAQEIVDEAEKRWYSKDEGVKRKTGKSGRMGVVTTVSPQGVTVTFGSRDLERAKYIRRPTALSHVDKFVTQGEWWAHKKAGGEVGPLLKTGQKWLIKVPNPAASDGQFLLQEFIGKPARALIKRINGLLPTEVAAELRRQGIK